MKHLNLRRLNILGIDIVATFAISASMVAAWMFFIKPSLSRTVHDVEASHQLADVRKLASDETRRLAAAQAELIRVKRELQAYQQPCWTDPDRNARIQQLFTIGKNHELDIESIEPSEAETIGGRKAMPLRLLARGSTTELIATLTSIRTEMPDIVLRTLEVSPAPDPTLRYVIVSAELLWIPPVTPAPPSTPTPPNQSVSSIR